VHGGGALVEGLAVEEAGDAKLALDVGQAAGAREQRLQLLRVFEDLA